MAQPNLDQDAIRLVVVNSVIQLANRILLFWNTILTHVKDLFQPKTSQLLETQSPSRISLVTTPTLKDIPGPFPWPFFGTMLSRSVGTADLHQSNELLVKEYGTIVKLEHYWNYPLLILYDAEDIEQVQKVASIYRPEMEIVASHRRMCKDRYNSVGIVNSQGEEWKKFRTSIAPMYHHTLILSYVSSCDEILTDFVQLLRSSEKVQLENFDDLILRLAFENSSKFILNKRFHLLDPGRSEKMDIFLTASHQYFKALQVSMYGFPAWKYFPSRVWTEFVKNENEMYEGSLKDFSIFADVVDEEIENGCTGGLLKVILESDQLEINDRKTLVRDLILAAMEPIQNSTIITLHWISRCPEVEQKLISELKRILPEKDSKFDETCLQNVPYLKACLQEAFRISPTTPNLARFLENPTRIQNYSVPPQTLIICQHWFACLQDSNFYRAKEFIPERWLAGPEAPQFTPHRPRLLYHFGVGRRECPGRRFAFQEICITVAKLLRNFHFEFPNDLSLNYYFLQQPTFPIPVQTLDQINEELDLNILHQLTLVQDLCNLTGELGSMMSAGFVQIAKSRMVLGQTSLSSAACCDYEDSSEKALVTVSRTVNVSDVATDGETGPAPVSICHSLGDEDQKRCLAKIRQRVGGFMSPGSLLIAQDKFLGALDRIVELVNIQEELKQVMSRLEVLKMKKDELLVSNSEQ